MTESPRRNILEINLSLFTGFAWNEHMRKIQLLLFLDIIHHRVFYLKQDVSETGFCLHHQVENLLHWAQMIELFPISEFACGLKPRSFFSFFIPYLWTPAPPQDRNYKPTTT
jgi:hypothetical protein